MGVVTATSGSVPATVDVSLSALQTISAASNASGQITILLQTIPATNMTPEGGSTGTISVSSSTSCPANVAPTNANCAAYILVVPASNPSVGIFSPSGFTYSTPASGDVLFTVDAQAAQPNSGGATDCMPSEKMTSTNSLGQPLKAMPATTSDVAEIDFSGCM